MNAYLKEIADVCGINKQHLKDKFSYAGSPLNSHWVRPTVNCIIFFTIVRLLL